MSTTVGNTVSVLWNVSTVVGLEQSAEWDISDATTPSTLDPCYDDGRCGPFQQIETNFMVEGASTVTWHLRSTFVAKTPYTFQLQVGESANPFADDWRNVGEPVANTFTMTDPGIRPLGKQLVIHYRILLTNGDGNQYYSRPATVAGRLNMRDWLHAREITRQELLKLRQGPGGIQGFLLKKRRSGAACTKCLDPYTGEVLNSRCPICEGTRFVSGYYRALPCQYTDLTNVDIDEQRSTGPEGWSAPTAVQGRFLGSPMLATGDIWVDAASDLRYYVESVKVENRIRGVPVTLFPVVLNQLPFANVAYSIPLGG